MSVLSEIFRVKKAEVAAAKDRVPLDELKAAIADLPPTRGFRRALESSPHEISLIAEVKKASPSKGLIRPDFDPAQVAGAYAAVGADALSVLTDVDYFQGAPENLQISRSASGLPCLRKDFIFDPYQVYQARAWGADAILLIVAGIDAAVIPDLSALAADLGMDALVEVHTMVEAETALELGCNFIGVNNRDLSNFSTSLDSSDRILPFVAHHAFAVSESALETKADIDRVRQTGAKAVLIGTTFCASPNIEDKVREVMGW